MLLLYITIIGVLIAASAQAASFPWSAQGWAPAAWAAGAAALCAAGSAALSAWVVRSFGRASIRVFAARARRAVACARALAIALYAALAYTLGWPQFVDGMLGLRGVPVVREAALIAPFLVMLLISLWPAFRVERMTKGARLRFRDYAWFQARHYVAAVLLAWFMLVGGFEAAHRLFPRTTEEPWAEWALSLGLMAGLYASAPFALRFFWRTEPLPPGELRARLEALCCRAGLKYRELLLWRTEHSRMANACIAGASRFVRYIVLTDALVSGLSPDEIAAVFAHEIGHVKHRHMLFYVWLAVCYGLTQNMLDAGAEALFPASEAAQLAATLAGMTVFWFGWFGFISRRLELQADLYAVRLAGDPAVFASALERIALLNGMDPARGSWRHFSIARRVGFLFAAFADPAVERRFRRSLWAIHLATLALAAGGGIFALTRSG